MEDLTSIFKKAGQEQASQRDKGRKNAYKRGEGYHRVGVEKYQEKDSERERERERERDCIFDFLSFLVDSSYLGKEICAS